MKRIFKFWGAGIILLVFVNSVWAGEEMSNVKPDTKTVADQER